MHHHVHPWTVLSLFCCHYLSGCLSKMAALPICLSSPSASKRQVTWLGFPCMPQAKALLLSVKPHPVRILLQMDLSPEATVLLLTLFWTLTDAGLKAAQKISSLSLSSGTSCAQSPNDNSKSPWIRKAFDWVQSSQEPRHFVFFLLLPYKPWCTVQTAVLQITNQPPQIRPTLDEKPSWHSGGWGGRSRSSRPALVG